MKASIRNFIGFLAFTLIIRLTFAVSPSSSNSIQGIENLIQLDKIIKFVTGGRYG